MRQRVYFTDMLPTRIATMTGSPGGTRTPDKVVNSHLLYQLSYRGTGATPSFSEALGKSILSVN